MRLWRLTRPEYAPGLDGEGARLWGGRWNSPGIPVVYAASSLALAALETLVNLPPNMRLRGKLPELVAVAIDCPDDLAPESLDLTLVPAQRSLAESRAIGDEWIRKRSSLMMVVPSHVIQQENNVLLNPVHSDIGRVRVVETIAFRFDERLSF